MWNGRRRLTGEAPHAAGELVGERTARIEGQRRLKLLDRAIVVALRPQHRDAEKRVRQPVRLVERHRLPCGCVRRGERAGRVPLSSC